MKGVGKQMGWRHNQEVKVDLIVLLRRRDVVRQNDALPCLQPPIIRFALHKETVALKLLGAEEGVADGKDQQHTMYHKSLALRIAKMNATLFKSRVSATVSTGNNDWMRKAVKREK